MYEELTGNLRAQATHFSVHDETSLLLLKAADAIEELQSTVKGLKEQTDLAIVEEKGRTLLKIIPKWIPVTERLPEDLTRVIVFCEDGVSYGLCEHLIADDEEVVEWHDFLHYPITPTHWMPLPEPPESEE